MTTISPKTTRYICTLTRLREVDPDRGHEIRVRAHADMTPAEADEAIRELQACLRKEPLGGNPTWCR
jgi:hypothetical protein